MNDFFDLFAIEKQNFHRIFISISILAVQQAYSPDTNEQASFSFAATIQGMATIVTVVHTDDGYAIYSRGKLIGTVRLGNDGYTWTLAEGGMPEPQFIQELGQRIESYYC